MALNDLNPNSMVLTNGASITSGDWNSLTPNSIFYQASGGASNRPAANNGMAMYISTRGQGGTHDDTTNERAAQLYFGDTTSYGNSGFKFRVRQGTSGWHEWSRVMHSKSRGAIIQTAWAENNSVTATSSMSGFEALKASLTPNHTSSHMLVIANVYGAASDDAHAWLEYKIGSGGWTRNSILNGIYNSGAAMGDYAYARSDDGGDANDGQTGYGTSVVWHPNTTAEVQVRVICSAENNTGGGFRLNIGRSGDTASSYNNATTKSTLLIQEIGWGDA